MMIRCFYLAVAFGWGAVLATAAASAQPPCQWVEATGAASDEQMTAEEARRAALWQARYYAVESASGREVSGITIVRDAVTILHFVRSLAEGYVVEERARFDLQPYQPSPGDPPSVQYRVHLDACVAPRGPKKDHRFILNADLNQALFLDGDRSAKLTLSCSQDCHLTIFNLTGRDRVKLYYDPQYLVPPLPLKAKESLLFPPQGIRLRMQLPEGHKGAVEAFLVVATKKPYDFHFLLRERTEVSLGEFYKALLSVPQEETTEAFLPYEIRRQGEP